MRRWWYRWWPLGLAALSACATANAYPPPAAGQFASVEGSVAQARGTGRTPTPRRSSTCNSLSCSWPRRSNIWPRGTTRAQPCCWPGRTRMPS